MLSSRLCLFIMHLSIQRHLYPKPKNRRRYFSPIHFSALFHFNLNTFKLWETIIYYQYEPFVEEDWNSLFLSFAILIIDRHGTDEKHKSPFRCYSVVAPGDTIHVIGEFDSEGKCEINRGENFLIVHPDILVSGTRVCPINYFSFVCFNSSKVLSFTVLAFGKSCFHQLILLLYPLILNIEYSVRLLAASVAQGELCWMSG